MSKKKDRDAGAGGKRRHRDLVKLERRLDELLAREQRQVAKLARTQEQIRAVKERLVDLGGPIEPAPQDASGAPPGGSAGGEASLRPVVVAYCLRERRRVELADPVPQTLRNGRAAFAGICPGCGARIVALAARQA